MIDFVRRFAGAAWSPSAVLLPYGWGREARLAERVLDAPVRCDQDGVGIAVPLPLLGFGLPDADAPDAAGVLHSPAGALPARLSAVAADIIAMRLLGGDVDLEGASHRLRIHPRTLQRRLAEEGTSYRELVDRMREARARLLLAGADGEIAEIAMSLGYQEPSHFTRAFRRWTGSAPSRWRRRAGAG